MALKTKIVIKKNEALFFCTLFPFNKNNWHLKCNRLILLCLINASIHHHNILCNSLCLTKGFSCPSSDPSEQKHIWQRCLQGSYVNMTVGEASSVTYNCPCVGTTISFLTQWHLQMHKTVYMYNNQQNNLSGPHALCVKKTEAPEGTQIQFKRTCNKWPKHGAGKPEISSFWCYEPQGGATLDFTLWHKIKQQFAPD